jgi:hypothetical protein
VVSSAVFELQFFQLFKSFFVPTNRLRIVVKVSELLLNLTDDLLGCDLLLVVALELIVTMIMSFEPILSLDCSAGHVSSEVSLNLGHSISLVFSRDLVVSDSRWTSAINRNVQLFILLSLAAGGTHNILI